MAYGQPKITATEVKKKILEAIDTKLSQQANFNDGLAYFGFNCIFALNIDFVSRGEDRLEVRQTVTVSKHLQEGELPGTEHQKAEVSGSLKEGKQPQKKA